VPKAPIRTKARIRTETIDRLGKIGYIYIKYTLYYVFQITIHGSVLQCNNYSATASTVFCPVYIPRVDRVGIAIPQ